MDYCDCNPEFTIADPAVEVTIKPGTKKIVEIIIYEVGLQSFFFVVLLSLDMNYRFAFPSAMLIVHDSEPV